MGNKIIWVLVILAVAGGVYLLKQNSNQNSKESEDTKPDDTQPILANTLEGTLRVSNDKKRGNLMLELVFMERKSSWKLMVT